MESRTINATRNIIFGVIQKMVGILLPFITRTVMIYTMGMNYVGLGSLFSSILQVLSLAELGVGSAMVFSMYKPIAEGDDAKVNALLNLYKKCYRIIGIVILVFGLAITPFLDYLIASDLPSDINLQLLFIVYLVNNLISYFIFGYKQSIFTASQRVDLISKIGLFLQLLSSVAQIIALLLFKNYYMYVIVIPVITLLNNIMVGIITDKRFPQYKAAGKLSKADTKEISKRVGGLIFQKIGNIVLSSVDTIVISSFLGLKVLGIYNGYYYIITALFSFMGVLQISLVPSIGNMVLTKSKNENYEMFKTLHFIYLWIVMWWSSCLLCLYQPFIELWQGTENMLGFDIVVALTVYFYVYKMGDMSGVFKESLGLWWENKSVPLISSIVNLLLNVLLVQKIGLLGIVIATIVAVAFVNVPFGGIVLFDKYFNDRKKFARYLAMIFFCFIAAAIASGITYYICSCFIVVNIGTLFLKGVICVFVPNIVLVFIHWNNPDFKLALNFVIDKMPTKLKKFLKG